MWAVLAGGELLSEPYSASERDGRGGRDEGRAEHLNRFDSFSEEE